ncbi:predicted protein [Nematostella vectensis]|uniref:F5/8 type C domain-containing protein n=1 Tax=Nematostella vectensis TaxID=45351 RepID=A7S301_NEMVE|nr:predicted protein [Nematostella vectensis]|eukprot:XP_001633933.1 predicted protein [Nematostella vectensis]
MYENDQQWIQVDFRKKNMIVWKVATQGHGRDNKYVKSYAIEYSLNRATWKMYQITPNSPGLLKVFPGNSDDSSVATNKLNPAIQARYLKIRPKNWTTYISLRLEFYGSTS